MPIVYETRAEIAQNGHLQLDLDDLPFETGTQFVVKLIPQLSSFDPQQFQQRMQAFMETCTQNSPYHDMSKSEILAQLRRQREEMYDEYDHN